VHSPSRGAGAALSDSHPARFRARATIRCTRNAREPENRPGLLWTGRSLDRSSWQRWRARGSGAGKVAEACMPRGHAACRTWIERSHPGGVRRTRVGGVGPRLRAREAPWGNDRGRHPLWRHWTQAEAHDDAAGIASRCTADVSGPETFARGSFLFALPLRAVAAASRRDTARCSAQALHHRWPDLMSDRHSDAACTAKL
jgi:hypothetical protein